MLRNLFYAIYYYMSYLLLMVYHWCRLF